MNETIIISQEEYRELLKIKERMECVKRFLAKESYCTLSDIRLILDIKPDANGSEETGCDIGPVFEELE